MSLIRFREAWLLPNCYIFLPSFKLAGFPASSVGKESACNVGDPGLIPGWRRSPGEGEGYPLQYSGLENSTHYTVHRAAKSQTGLSDFHFRKGCSLDSSSWG